jgi:hypothetical protein
MYETVIDSQLLSNIEDFLARLTRCDSEDQSEVCGFMVEASELLESIKNK